MTKKYTSNNKVIPLIYDVLFKNIIKDRKNKKFLCKLISLYAGLDYEYLLKHIKVIDTDVLESNILEHHNTGDVLVDVENNRINIELSINNKVKNKRKNEVMAYKYTSNMYKVGEEYEIGYNFIQIVISNYKVFNNDLLVTESRLVEVSSGKYELETEEFKKYHVCLSNLAKTCYTKSASELSEIEKYTMMFKIRSIDKLEEIVSGDEILEGVLNSMKSLSEDKGLISAYEKEQIEAYCERIARNEERKQDREKAIKQGLNKGLKEGLKLGIEQRNIEVAKNMLKEISDLDLISRITGLTKEELKKIN